MSESETARTAQESYAKVQAWIKEERNHPNYLLAMRIRCCQFAAMGNPIEYWK